MSNKKNKSDLKAYRSRVKGKKSQTSGRKMNVLLLFLSALVVVFVGSFALKFSLGESAPHEIEPVFSRFQVLNGCGIKGVAAQYSKYIISLSNDEFTNDVIDEGNFKSFDRDKTLLIVRNAKTTDANKVAFLIGLSEEQVIHKKLEDNFLDINYTLIVGKDYQQYLNSQ